MRKSVFLLLTLLLVFGAALAQTPTGRIVGRVADDQGMPLPGVSVVAVGPRLVGQAAAVTDENGTYRLFALPSGMYTVTFTLEGFKPIKREAVELELEKTITLNVTMEPGTVAEEITVVGQSPLIDVKSTTKGTTIKKETFMALPKGRNFNSLLSMMPGVQFEANTGGLSVDGATGTENVFHIDGVNVNSVHIGTQQQGAVFEQVEEIKVTASGYNAEFGGAMGGVVNVVTRSGGNEFHGDVIGYYNDNSLLMNAKTRDQLRYSPYDDYAIEYFNQDDLYFNRGKDRDRDRQIEGVFNLGGYIVKDLLWFYASFDPVSRVQKVDRWFTSDTPAYTPDDPIADPRAGRPLYEYVRKDWTANAAAKITAQPVRGLRLSASWINNFTKYRGPTNFPNLTGTSSKDQPWNDYGYDFPNLSAAFQADYSASNSLLVSLRGGYFMQNTTNQQVKMETTRWVFGTSNMGYDVPEQLKHYAGWSNTAMAPETKSNLFERLSANLDTTYYMNLGGEHAWKFGLQFVRMAENVDRSYQHPLVTLNWGTGYDGLASGEYVMGTYGHYQIRGSFSSPYGWVWDIHTDNWAVYLQDSWTIADRLTLNLGVRTESEYIPSFADPNTGLHEVKPIKFDFQDKIAPRFGAVYDVFGDSSLKVFGSFGIYYDVMKLYMAEGAYGGFKWVTDYYELNDPDWTRIAASGEIDDRAGQTAGNRYVGSMNWRLPSFDTTDPGLKPTSKSELSFGADKKLTEELSFSARFVRKHLIRTIEDIGVLTLEGEKYYNANPSEGWSRPISQGGRFDDKYWPCPKPDWNYYGVNLALERRFADNWQGGLNYTWSRTTGCYGGLSSTDENGRNSPNVERYYDLWFLQYDLHGNSLDGPLPSDRPHYIKVYGSYAFPFGLTVGAIGYLRSGQPLTTSLNLNNVVIYPENRFDTGERLPTQYWLDIYAEYNLRIARRYTLNINLNINQLAPKIATAKNTRLNRDTIHAEDDEILSKNFDYMSKISTATTGPTAPLSRPNLQYNQVTNFMNGYTARLGFRFSF